MPTNPDPDLMRIFNFTAADLEANRAGRLSDRQIEKLSSRKKQGQWLAGIGCIAVIVFAVLLGVSSSTRQENSDFLIVLIVGALPIVFVYLGVMDRHDDLEKGKIRLSESKLYISAHREKYGMSYSLYATNYYSGLTENTYTDIDEFLRLHGKDTQFRLYYAPNSNELLSIEIID